MGERGGERGEGGVIRVEISNELFRMVFYL